jgi:hypothetical protein
MKVVELTGTWRQEVQKDMLDQLDNFRTKVERGEVTGLSIVASMRDGTYEHVTTKTEDFIRHTGALIIVLHRNLINGPTEIVGK